MLVSHVSRPTGNKTILLSGGFDTLFAIAQDYSTTEIIFICSKSLTFLKNLSFPVCRKNMNCTSRSWISSPWAQIWWQPSIVLSRTMELHTF